MSGASSTTAFDQLLGELELMTKALPADEAAGDDKADDKGGEAAAAADAADADGDKGGESDEQMTKSFKVTLADGTEVDAQDGTELVKALTDRIEKNEGSLLKALGSATALIKAQGEQLKKLTETVAKLSGEGRGRKAVLTVVERPEAAAPMRKSEDQGMKPQEFLAKAEQAFNAGRITGRDLMIAETHINRGSPVPANIVSSVVGQ